MSYYYSESESWNVFNEPYIFNDPAPANVFPNAGHFFTPETQTNVQPDYTNLTNIPFEYNIGDEVKNDEVKNDEVKNDEVKNETPLPIVKRAPKKRLNGKRTVSIKEQITPETQTNVLLNYTTVLDTQIEKNIGDEVKTATPKPSTKRGPKRPLTGKQMISMKESGRKKRKVEEEEEFQLRDMERFVTTMFCKKCQDAAKFDGKTLTIELCARCCKRANSFEKL